jgi:hypothetical protein
MEREYPFMAGMGISITLIFFIRLRIADEEVDGGWWVWWRQKHWMCVWVATRGGKALDGRHEFADLSKFSKLMSLFRWRVAILLFMDFHVLVFERVLARRAGGINTSLSARDCSSFSSHPYSLLQFPKAATRTVDAFGLSLRSIQKKNPVIFRPCLLLLCLRSFKNVDWTLSYVFCLSVSVHSQNAH